MKKQLILERRLFRVENINSGNILLVDVEIEKRTGSMIHGTAYAIYDGYLEEGKIVSGAIDYNQGGFLGVFIDE